MRKGGLKSTYSLDFHSIDEVLGGLSAADVLEPGAPAEDADGRVCAMLATDALSHEDADDLPLTGNLPEAHGLRNDVLRLALAAKHCTEEGGNHVVRAAGGTFDQLVDGCRSLTRDVLGLTKTSVSDRSNGYQLSRAATAAARVRRRGRTRRRLRHWHLADRDCLEQPQLLPTLH